MKFEEIGTVKRVPEKSTPLILVIDNDSDNLLLARCVIESLGMNCLVSHDSKQALSLIYNFLPNLILLDIVMPNFSGIDIAREIKHDSKTQGIPIIAVTGLTREREKTLIFEAGFDDYVCKPYLIEELENKISLVLEHDYSAS